MLCHATFSIFLRLAVITRIMGEIKENSEITEGEVKPRFLHFLYTYVLHTRGGTEPGSARLASIRGKSSGKARLGAGSKIFGS